MHSELRIEILPRPWSMDADIYIYRRHSDGRVASVLQDDKGNPHEVMTEPGAPSPATLTVPRDFLPLLAEAIEKFGVKLPEASFTSGKLEATEHHLQDLRKLLKL